jgi:outer membrane protein
MMVRTGRWGTPSLRSLPTRGRGLKAGLLKWGLAAACAIVPPAAGAQAVAAPMRAEGSAAASASRPFTLPDLIAYALAHNPELAAAGFDGEAAAARTRGADAARYPRLAVEGGYTNYGPDLRLTAARFNGEPGVFGANVVVADLVLRVPLYTGGRLTAELQAAELLELSAGQRLARSRGDLVYNVSSLYFTQLAQTRLIGALAESRDALQSQLARVRALVDERKAAAVDALRTEVRLADVGQRLLREQNNLEILRRSLLNLLGDRTGELQISLYDTLGAPTVAPRDPRALIERALAQRPDIEAARTELQAQSARIEAARAGNRPSVSLLAAGGGRAMLSPSQQPPGTSAQDTTYRIGVLVDIPVFDGGRTSERVAEESAKLAAQRERLDKLSLQVRLEIETAHASLSSALERIRSAEQTVALARENLHIEQEKYALGRGTAFDVLDAQSALTDARAAHIRALADANTAAAQLAWSSGENLP